MQATRREILTGGTLALFGGGFLSRVDSVAAMQGRPAPSLTKTLSGQATGTSAALLLAPKAGAEGPPEPADYDRLPLEWNKRTVKRFRKRLAEKDIENFLLGDGVADLNGVGKFVGVCIAHTAG